MDLVIPLEQEAARLEDDKTLALTIDKLAHD